MSRDILLVIKHRSRSHDYRRRSESTLHRQKRRRQNRHHQLGLDIRIRWLFDRLIVHRIHFEEIRDKRKGQIGLFMGHDVSQWVYYVRFAVHYGLFIAGHCEVRSKCGFGNHLYANELHKWQYYF